MSSESEITRRSLLGGSVATMFVPLGATAVTQSARTNSVGIIGGGFAGLACGYELAHAGWSVDVFEARNRFGGRVHTRQEFTPGQHVEIGAELIGKNHPHWKRYAQHFGIKLVEVGGDADEPPKTYYFHGQKIEGKDRAAIDRELETAEALLTKAAESVDAEHPWQTPDAATLDSRSVADWLQTISLSATARAILQAELEYDMAVPVAQMNWLALLCTIKAHGGAGFWENTETHRTATGNQQLASRLAEGITAKHGQLHLDAPIRRVKVMTDRAELTLADGRVLSFDHVVLTAPPSTWGQIQFEPALPQSLLPQMGTATKFLAACTHPFWAPRQSPDSLTDTMVGSTWEGPTGAGSGRSLVGFAGGPVSQALSTAALPKTAAQVTDAFQQVLPGFKDAVLKSEFVNWPAEPWTKGGYSFPAPGKFLAQSRIFNNGIGRLQFAGEHTSLGFIGYMEGALETGVARAQRLQRLATGQS